MKPVVLVACLALIVGCRAGRPPAPPPTVSPLDQLQGVWRIVAAEKDGKPDETLVTDWVAIDGDGLLSEGHTSEAKIVANAETTPHHIDVIYGALGQGPRVKGIYRLENSVLTVCLAPGEGRRPASFSSANGQLLLTLRQFLVN